MPRSKIDKVKLNQLLRSGKTQRECSKIFGVSDAAISKARKELNIHVVRNVCMENAHEVVRAGLNEVKQLEKINLEANKILDEAESNPDIALRAMGEIRNQLKLQLDILRTLYDLKAVQQFQQEVLEVIAGVDKDVRNKIINRLNARQALRTTLQLD
jgi:hypothetical protein